MIDTHVQTDVTFFDQLHTALATFPEAVTHWTHRSLGPFVGQRVQLLLRAEPGPVYTPIAWTPSKHPEDQNRTPNVYGFGAPYYSRQKAAYFATDGFGHGIPYTRTHKVAYGWRYQIDTTRGSLTVFLVNAISYAPFVYGTPTGDDWQQRFHRNTGWIHIRETRQALVLDIEDYLAVGLPALLRDIVNGTYRYR